MLRFFNTDQKSIQVLYIVLLSIIGVLIIILIIGTIFGLARSSDKPLFSLGSNVTITPTLSEVFNDDIRVFSGIGRLRIPLSNSSILILSIAFPYNASDITFTEELATKIGNFKEIANEYFSSLPAERIIQIDEEAAKTEILRRYNVILRLGKIDALYFSDMMIIDAAF
jgi:flagellar basal body-associated protein FliL